MLVRRDPFARQELHRRTYSVKGDCNWCGSNNIRVYEYWTETDGGRSFEHKGTFCCDSCHDEYHEVLK